MRQELTRWAYEALRDAGFTNIEMEANYWLLSDSEPEPSPVDTSIFNTPETKTKINKTQRTVSNRKRLPNDFLAFTDNWRFAVGRLSDRGRIFANMAEELINKNNGRIQSKKLRLTLAMLPPLNLTCPQASQNVTDLINAGVLAVNNSAPNQQ